MIRCRVTINWHELRVDDYVQVDPDNADVRVGIARGYLVPEPLTETAPSHSIPAAVPESPERSD